jgi:hypothetical protein
LIGGTAMRVRRSSFEAFGTEDSPAEGRSAGPHHATE